MTLKISFFDNIEVAKVNEKKFRLKSNFEWKSRKNHNLSQNASFSISIFLFEKYYLILILLNNFFFKVDAKSRVRPRMKRFANNLSWALAGHGMPNKWQLKLNWLSKNYFYEMLGRSTQDLCAKLKAALRF